MIFILYPHQLFENITSLKGKKILLVEEPLFFTQYTFHIQKLILHRASMKFYQSYLEKNGFEVFYFEDERYLEIYKNNSICIYDVCDDFLHKKITKNFKHLTILANPNFLNTNDTTLFLQNFYINRRKELNIFVDKNKQPFGGKWSFDSENRASFSQNIVLPPMLVFQNYFIDEAQEYVRKLKTIGEAKEFYYPTTFSEAKELFAFFLHYKLDNFGKYQDAIEGKNHFLFHSNISSSLNIGLLSLEFVITQVRNANAPFNSKEGFIRQIIGWREFMLSVYKSRGIQMRNSNYFGHQNSISPLILEAKSGLSVLDDVMHKLHKSGYNHHIERLMILGNLFLLLEISPNAVHEFFMSHYIDAYDWVMVGNVYGMSAWSDGGTIATKPYISSSNYILKMSKYKKDSWCEIWDALYWRFLSLHRVKLESNFRMKMQFAILDKMPKSKLLEHISIAQKFIDKCTKED